MMHISPTFMEHPVHHSVLESHCCSTSSLESYRSYFWAKLL